jgi:hypothetical protein
MENEYADDLINWGGQDGTRESYERKKKQFYDDLYKYANLNKLS